MHVPAANFISPTARVTAAARQAGEEMGGGRPSQTTEEEAGPEQPRDPSAPTAGRKGRGTNRGCGARGAAHEQHSMSAATSWGCHPACPILSPLSLFLPLGLSAPASPAARTTRSLAFLMTNTFSFFRCETHLLSRRSLPTAA